MKWLEDEKDLSFSKGLKAYIDRKGWTIKHVARKTGAPEHTLYAWTSGSRIPAGYIQEWLFKVMDGIE